MEHVTLSPRRAGNSEHQFFSNDGAALAGSHRPGIGRSILLAHGFGQTRQSWATTQRVLADAGHGSLAWDMRGHGESSRNPPTEPYDVDQFVADQRAAVDTLGGVDLPVLVGASMGGLVGLLTQAAHRCFTALVLVDVTPRWEDAGMQRIRAFMSAAPDGFETFEQAAQAIAEYLPQRRARKSAEQLQHLFTRDASGRLRWHWDPRLLAELVDDSLPLQMLISDAAKTVDVPVLLISGGRSDLVSDATVQHFLELVPRAQHVRLADATHMVAGDDNDAFTDTLLAFLRAQFPATSGPDERPSRCDFPSPITLDRSVLE